MSRLKIKSGETLIVEGVSQLEEAETPSCTVAKQSPVSHVEAGIRRHEVPADNGTDFFRFKATWSKIRFVGSPEVV